MSSGSQQNKIYGLQAENRHLKEMIGALREEMERMRVAEQERLQQAQAAANDESGQLKKMIAALRDELERRNIEYGENCRAVEQTAREEARQLHEMIRAMRSRLEGYEKK